LFMYVGWTAIQGSWPIIVNLSGTTAVQTLVAVGGIMKSIALRIAFLWLVLGALDYFFQRKQVDKQLRMSKEELKQEMKESETSPELRMAQMARRRRLSKGRMMDAVKTADVIVTNPTHFAVAIKYEPNKSHAPIVVAKGADFLAAKIREVAGDNRIPIVPNPPLARALYKQCEIGDYVPRELFQAVAEVLAFVYRTLKKVKVNA
jgi:flagellar biosynthesis protein FlhB